MSIVGNQTQVVREQGSTVFFSIFFLWASFTEKLSYLGFLPGLTLLSEVLFWTHSPIWISALQYVLYLYASVWIPSSNITLLSSLRTRQSF